MATRNARINALRGFCREFGLHVPVSTRTGIEALSRVIADGDSAIPDLLRPTLQQLQGETRILETRIAQLERQLVAAVTESPASKLLMSIPGIGIRDCVSG